jgi:hypothetical protein
LAWTSIQEAQVALLAGALHQALAEIDLADEARQAITSRVGELIAEADGGEMAPRRRQLTA